jgi:hypothetical protein
MMSSSIGARHTRGLLASLAFALSLRACNWRGRAPARLHVPTRVGRISRTKRGERAQREYGNKEKDKKKEEKDMNTPDKKSESE